MLTLCQYLHHTCCTNLCLYTSSSSSSWTFLSYHGLTSPCFCLTSHVLVKIKVSPCNSSSSLSSAASSLLPVWSKNAEGKFRVQLCSPERWLTSPPCCRLQEAGGCSGCDITRGRKSFGSGCDSASIIFLHCITSHPFNWCAFIKLQFLSS